MIDPGWFGPRLKELREAAGMTQQEVADLAGLTKAGISSLEQRKTRPHWDTVVAICQALKVGCEVFMRPPAERQPSGPGRPPKPKDEPAPEKPKRGKRRRKPK
jgi:transcriptional regulator with XRE-family HTH domain